MDLLPCPFCGGEAEYNNSDTGPHEWVECDSCGAKGPLSSYNEAGHVPARDAWNNRGGRGQKEQRVIVAAHRYSDFLRRMNAIKTFDVAYHAFVATLLDAAADLDSN